MHAYQDQADAPLGVDLEGGLVPTSLAWEAALRLVAERPLSAWRLLAWGARGKSFACRRLAEKVSLDPESLPYRPEVVAALREHSRRGGRVVLHSADPKLARAVAGHLGLSGEVGESGVPAAARGVYSTGPDGRRHRLDPPADEPVRRVAASVARELVRAARPHQWAKNLLLVAPLVLSHRPVDAGVLALVTAAFLAFSFSASCVYVINDLLDLPSDRRHPTKCRRPFAAGRASLAHGLTLALGLIALAVAVAASVSPRFLLLMGLYAGTSLCYSLWVKKAAILDVLCLAGLYTLRLFAGGLAANVAISSWLLVFSMFLFLSLALVKRYTELAARPRGTLPGRGYGPADLELLRSFGAVSGYLAVLVIGLYVDHHMTSPLYRNPEFLWFVCPVLLYWVTRVWLLAQRGLLSEDPVLFSLRDRASLVCGTLCLALFVAARL